MIQGICPNQDVFGFLGARGFLGTRSLWKTLNSKPETLNLKTMVPFPTMLVRLPEPKGFMYVYRIGCRVQRLR